MAKETEKLQPPAISFGKRLRLRAGIMWQVISMFSCMIENRPENIEQPGHCFYSETKDSDFH